MPKHTATPLLAEEQPTTGLHSGPVTREVTLTPAAPSMLANIDALAKDVDVDKLERLIAMNERLLAHQAKAAFNGAYARMQAELPEVDEKGKILVKNVLRSTYAKLEDIHAAVKPVLQRYGFAIRHRTEWPESKDKIIRIVGILSHEDGHSEESVFEAPMDRSEYRTDIQSMGSTVSYGRRYTTLDLLNIATRGADDDGRKSGRPQPPDHYDDWWDDLSAVADTGIKALEKAWGETKNTAFKEYTLNHNKEAWKGLKEKAQKVKE